MPPDPDGSIDLGVLENIDLSSNGVVGFDGGNIRVEYSSLLLLLVVPGIAPSSADPTGGTVPSTEFV